MTTTFTRTIRQAGLVLAFAVSIASLSSTSSFAFSSDAQAQCTGDAFRLCSSEIPNVSKITACMIRQRTSLSPGCRQVMDRDELPAVSGPGQGRSERLLLQTVAAGAHARGNLEAQLKEMRPMRHCQVLRQLKMKLGPPQVVERYIPAN